jgi:hypothetical protein
VSDTKTESTGSAPGPRAPRLDHLRVIAALAALVGIGLRVWYVTSPLGPPDSDESVVGLMARHILKGELFTFYWGQPYGSSHEALLVALLRGAGVPMRAAMELVPFALAVVCALLVWRIGLAVAGRATGILAGVVFWISSTGFVWNSTKERAFYSVIVVFGLAIVLFAIRLGERVTRRDAVLFGLAAGSGWWASPQIIYLAIPTGLWLAWRLLRRRDAEAMRAAPYALVAAIVASLPWIYTNVRNPLASLRVAASVPNTTYLFRLNLFRVTAFPIALGAKLPMRRTWWGGDFGKVGFVVAVALLGVAFVLLPARANVVRIGLVLYPLIFAALPTSFYVGEPRYLALMWPLVAVLAGYGIARLRWPAVRFVAVGIVAAITIGSTATFIHYASTSPGLLDAAPGDLTPLLARTRTDPIRLAFADYWVAQRLTLDSDERVIAAPLQFIRRVDYERRVHATANPPYILFIGSCYDIQLRRYLDANSIPYEATQAGGWSIVKPARKVLPEDALVDWAAVRGIGPLDHVC